MVLDAALPASEAPGGDLSTRQVESRFRQPPPSLHLLWCNLWMDPPVFQSGAHFKQRKFVCESHSLVISANYPRLSFSFCQEVML